MSSSQSLASVFANTPEELLMFEVAITSDTEYPKYSKAELEQTLSLAIQCCNCFKKQWEAWQIKHLFAFAPADEDAKQYYAAELKRYEKIIAYLSALIDEGIFNHE